MSVNISKLRSSLWPVWLFALVATFPVPHTIALRNVLLVGGLMGLPWRWRTTLAKLLALRRGLAWLAASGWILGALTA